MPTDTPKAKLESTKAYHPKIVLFDRMRENREEIARQIAAETNAIVLPSYDHPWVVAGQGTAALELLAEKPDLDAIFVPVGGGGLVGRNGYWPRRRTIRIFVSSAWNRNSPAIGISRYKAGKRIGDSAALTIADGLRTPIPGEVTFPIVSKLAEGVLLVSEDEIKAAVRFLLSRLKILTEPSGAVPAAALLHKKFPPESQGWHHIVRGERRFRCSRRYLPSSLKPLPCIKIPGRLYRAARLMKTPGCAFAKTK